MIEKLSTEKDFTIENTSTESQYKAIFNSTNAMLTDYTVSSGNNSAINDSSDPYLQVDVKLINSSDQEIWTAGGAALAEDFVLDVGDTATIQVKITLLRSTIDELDFENINITIPFDADNTTS